MNVAIIPARSGSKGVPNKNLRKLWGISFIGLASICARKANIFNKIILSTDSIEYANEGRRYGCEVPYLRPPHLSEDKSTILDVIKDIILKLDKSDEWKNIVLLEPTSPLRTPEIVRKCFELYQSESADSCFTVSKVPIKYHPRKQLKFDPEGKDLSLYSNSKNMVINRQELDQTYIRNGAAYVFQKECFLKGGDIIGRKNRALIINNKMISIDSYKDIDGLAEHPRPSWLTNVTIL